MSEYIAVRVGGLEAAIEAMESTHQQITDLLAAMDSALRPLDRDWTGDASAAYAVAMTDTRKAADDMAEALQEARTKTSEGLTRYQEADAKARDQWA